MGKMIAAFGECLLRMSPVMQGTWLKDAVMPVYLGGAELNTLTALARWQRPVRYITALPVNAMAEEMIAEIGARGIDTSAILRRGERIGTYYLPQGTDLQHAGVIYDRSASSFAGLEPGMVNWKEAFRDCDWFHFSAISPGVSERAAAVCLEAVKAASDLGLRISIDLNYRAKLWQYGVSPVDVMPGLLSYCGLAMGNPWAVESLLGLTAPMATAAGPEPGALNDAAQRSMTELATRFPSLEAVAYTFRMEQDYWATLLRKEAFTVSRVFSQGEVTDRVGSGDCFMAGLIHGLLPGNIPVSQRSEGDVQAGHAQPGITLMNDQFLIDFAAAAAVGKLKEKGDSTKQSVQDVLDRVNNQ